MPLFKTVLSKCTFTFLTSIIVFMILKSLSGCNQLKVNDEYFENAKVGDIYEDRSLF